MKMAKSRDLKSEPGPKKDVRLLELWLTLRGVTWWILHGLYRAWKLNPISLLRHRIRTLYKLGDGSDLPIKPRWIEFITDIFTSDVQRKIRLLQWVRSRVDHVTVDDFIFSWHDGIALCALLESVCPGVCPNYRLLRSDLRVNSCRFALQVAHKFLGIQRIILTPEEMAIADQSTELKIVHLVQMIRWKHQRMSATATADTDVKLAVRRVTSRCFARGAGLKTGMVGRRAKFNIFADTNGILEVFVDIRGPCGEMNSEKISTLCTGPRLKPPKLQMRSKVITDDSGNTFIRQKSFDEQSNEVIPFDYQSAGEGRFLVTYIPRNPGIHVIMIKSHNHHIQGSPYEVNISDCESPWNVVKSNKVILGSSEDAPLKQSELESLVSKKFLVAGSERARRHMGDLSNNYKVKRRVLKKVITRNGEETSLSEFSTSPSLSRQSSSECSDVSKRSDSSDMRIDDKRKKFKLIKQDIYFPDETSNDTSDSVSVLSTDSAALTSLENSISGSDAATNLNERYKVHPRVRGSLNRSLFRRSLSDSLIDDIDVVYNDFTKPEKAELTSLKMLKSKRLKTKCVYVNNSTVSESVGQLSQDRSVSVSSKPTLAEIQKMTRKWQSMDLSDIEAVKIETTILDSKEKDSSQQNTPLHDDLVIPTYHSSTSESKTNETESETKFKSLDTVNQDDNTINLECVSIVSPKAKSDKTTQVSATEIKEATGWHSGAFKIKKRRTRIYPQKHEKQDLIEGLAHGKHEATQSNDYNVQQWLQKHGREHYNVLDDRQSTVDTSDSGISDEAVQKQHHSGRRGSVSNSQHVPTPHPLRENSQALELGPADKGCSTYLERNPQDELGEDLKLRICSPEDKQEVDLPFVESSFENSDDSVAKPGKEHSSKESRTSLFKGSSIDSDPPAERGDFVDSVEHTPPMASTNEKEISTKGAEKDGVQDRDSRQLLKTGHTDLSATKDSVDGLTPDTHLIELTKTSPSKVLVEEVFKETDSGQKRHKATSLTKDRVDDLIHDMDLRQLIMEGKKDSVGDFFDRLLSAHSLKSMENMLETNPFTGTDLYCPSPDDVSEEDNCLAFGAGLSYGHVGIKNNFQVWVRDDKKGSVCVTVCGPKPNCVTETTTLYTGDNLYEIFYQVTHPGYYVITVTYALNSVPNSPFIAKVAWDH